MNHFSFWKKLAKLTLGKLCRQRMLLAGLALLCFLLPVLFGPAVNAALSRGVSFDRITLAVVAPEQDPMAQQLEQILSGMQDIRKYCQVKAMSRQEAQQHLERGEITAALILPENFVSGILYGSNPDVILLVPPDRPLEALLTLWLGQSAADLLAAFQSGIYTVLELYTQNPPADLSYQDVVARINLRYISWTLNRQDLYRIQTIPVTGHLPISVHYRFSLFAYLLLAMAPIFSEIYSQRWIRSLNRFRSAGIGPIISYSAAIAACSLIVSGITFLFQMIPTPGNILIALLSSLLCGLFCALFGSLCCLLSTDTGSCGILSFTGSLAFLFFSGGIIPPVLMPGRLHSLLPFSPVTWLRNILAVSGGHEIFWLSLLGLAVSIPVMFLAGCLLYGHRGQKEVADL